MARSTLMIILLPLLASFASGFHPCPLSSPAFASPTCLKDDKNFRALAQQLDSIVGDALTTGRTPHGAVDTKATAYSFSLFSIDDPNLLWERHFTPDIVRNGSFGVKEVDSDTVYRVGSISKLITVYTFLAAVGDGYWHRPITDFVPELRDRTINAGNEVDYMQWDQVTLAQLAGQTSGLTRDFQQLPPPLAPSFFPDAQVLAAGLPLLSEQDMPKCILNVTTACDRAGFFANIDSRQPTCATNSQPIYSNAAFQILAYALEAITGKTFQQIMSDSLLDPLSIGSIFYSKPEDSLGVIPVDPTITQWNGQLGDLSPGGAFYASPSSISSLGRSILSSTLLAPNVTRAWLKPHAFTASLNTGIGLPWEIYRAPIYGNRVTDLYSKSGEVGGYSANLVLLPDYGVGYTVFTAGEGAEPPLRASIADAVIPALEEIARQQTEKAFAGEYAATTGLNSSITLRTAAGLPGLGVDRWISNGTNVFDSLKLLQGTKQDLSIRLYPTDLKHDTGNGTVEHAWRAVIETITESKDFGPFAACLSWFNVDGPASYGRHALDQFLFVTGEEGVVSIQPRAFEAVLEKAV